MDRYNAKQQRKNAQTVIGGVRSYIKDGELKCELINDVDYSLCLKCHKELFDGEFDYHEECEP